jgi:uncharacterized protein (DUF362 family)
MKSTVAIARIQPRYPTIVPFEPSQPYPEYPFDSVNSGESNEVYEAVRQNLASLRLDRARLGTRTWNPLGELVQRGGTVLLKPNLVVSEHPEGAAGLVATVAHPSILRALADYAYGAVGPDGLIIVGDSPTKEVDFAKVCSITGLAATVEALRARGVPIEIRDFRDLQATRGRLNTIVETKRLPGDPLGYVIFDLAAESLFGQLPVEKCRRLRSTAAVYEDEASKNHTPSRNLYSVARSALAADLVISIAKLKSHRKSGLTGALKNTIGVTNEKRWLPHHRVGTPAQGGDICPDGAPLWHKMGESMRQSANASRWGKPAFQVLKPSMRFMGFARRRLLGNGHAWADLGEGDWWGNDTIWRTTLDMNVLLRYGTRDGRVASEPQRSYLAVVDAVLAGEGEGPLCPVPKEVGVVLASQDPVACDLVAARLAGFDPSRIPTISRAAEAGRPLGTNDCDLVRIVSAGGELAPEEVPVIPFEPSKGWKGYIEASGRI